MFYMYYGDGLCIIWCLGASGLSLSHAGTLSAQNSRKPVAVYADENALPSLLPEQNEEYSSVPLPEVIDRENQLQPGRWNDHRVSTVTLLLLIVQYMYGMYGCVCLLLRQHSGISIEEVILQNVCSFVRYCGQGSSLLWTPALRPLCRSNAPAQGEEGNW